MPQESINTPAQKASFSAAISGLVVAAAATDFFTIRGVDGKRIVVNRMLISGIATAATAVPLSFIKRSTANTGGTATSPTAVPSDSTIGTAPAAVVSAYTVNPAGLGTAVGTVSAMRLILSTASASVGSTPLELNLERMFWRPIVLNSAAESLCINYGGATAAGNAIDLMVAWTEEQF
jgi:hypothetical protein